MAGKKQQTYARNANELAGYFFADLKKAKPRIFQQKVKECLAWTHAEDFPKKTKKGWELAAVSTWNTERYSKAQAQVAEAAAAAGELPLQPSESERESILNKIPDEATRRRLRQLLSKWENPNSEVDKALTKREHDELIAYGLVKDFSAIAQGKTAKAGEPPHPSLLPQGGEGIGGDTMRGADGKLLDCESQKALAMRLAMLFAGRISIDLSEQQISRWKSDANSLPPGAVPPPPKIGNRFATQLWYEWIEKFILPHYQYGAQMQGGLPGLSVQAANARWQQEIDAGVIKSIERQNAERAHSEKWIEMEDARTVFSAGIIALREEFRTLAERQQPLWLEQKAKAVGWPDEQVRTLRGWALEWGTDAVDRIDDFCERQSRACNHEAKQKVNERIANEAT